MEKKEYEENAPRKFLAVEGYYPQTISFFLVCFYQFSLYLALPNLTIKVFASMHKFSNMADKSHS